MSQNPTQETSLNALEALLFPRGTYRRVICIFDQALANNIDHVVGLILRLVQKGAAVTLVSSGGVTLNAGSFNVVNDLSLLEGARFYFHIFRSKTCRRGRRQQSIHTFIYTLNIIINLFRRA